MRNLKPLRRIAILAVFFLCSAILSAQESRGERLFWGTFHSPKGFGFSLETGGESGHFRSISAYADLSAILRGDAYVPGYRTTYLYNIILKDFRRDDGMLCQLFAGPGVTAGYVRDHDLMKGIIGGLAFAAGARFEFPSRFSVTVEFQGDAAVHIHRHAGGTDLRMYENGLRRIYYPQLIVSYRF